MAGELEGSNMSGDPSRMRISDADRHTVAEVLRMAAGDGRLDFDELDERLEQTFAAKTYADLVPITVDLVAVTPVSTSQSTSRALGATAGSVVGRSAGLPHHAGSLAIMGECKRSGAWHVPPSHTAFALMGNVLIDLRLASLANNDITINASAVMGEVKIVVPAHFNVVVSGIPIMGDYSEGKDKVEPDLGPESPTIRVRGIALMGSVKVRRLPAPGTPKKILGTY